VNKKYTILSFNFNGYDKLREPLICDPDAEYIYVTDKNIKSKNWNIVIDTKLTNKNPIYSSYYVRYHPFEYAKTDIVFVIDSSIQLKESLRPIYEEFLNSNCDQTVMLSNYPDDEHKISEYLNISKRIDKADALILYKFIFKSNQTFYKGSICQCFIVYRNNNTIHQLNNLIWNKLLELGHYGIPNRMDEVIAHKIMGLYSFKPFFVSSQIVYTGYMSYNKHKLDIIQPAGQNYDQYYYFNNKPIKPIRFEIGNKYFPRTYKYKTEAILLTKYLNEKDLVEWLEYHLYKCKFEHIQVFDNESSYDVKSICQRYKNVSYEYVAGIPRQYKIYDDYINNKSEALWVMPIDDDEYLTFTDEFNSIYDAIIYYENKIPHMNMLAIRWKHLFPKKFHTERHCPVLEYCTEENTKLAETFMYLGDRTVKTIVKRYGEIHYEETVENPAGGHVPKNTTFFGAILFNGMAVTGCGVNEIPEDISDEKIRLLHCRYKGYSEYMKKSAECKTISDVINNDKNFKFNTILNDLD